MLFDSQVLAFAAVAAVLTVTPGADTFLVVRNVARGGAKGGLATTSGVTLGVFGHAALSALGVSVVLARSAEAFTALKLAGAAYLVWLGGRSLIAAFGPTTPSAVPDVRGDGARRSAFAEGLTTNLLNPKVAVFYLAFLPQFISAGDPVLAKSLLLAAIHAVEGLIWLGALSFALGGFGAWLARPVVRRGLDGTSGAVLCGFGARLALKER
jgi:threonine/homoserine/homoserine lactone efflux protein